jgi:tRNA(fMet)-specific endonuclease VapC
MFAILDTNHFVALVAGGVLAQKLSQHALARDADLFTTIITAQEITQGWLAAINGKRAGMNQIFEYGRFQGALLDFNKITILAFDCDAAETFAVLRKQACRVGTMDLKIAAIAMAHDALLLSRNLKDFGQIPGLRVENWLD